MLLDAHRLQLYAQDKLLVKIDTLRVDQHARIGLVGRNGCGKTTLLEVLAGLREPDAGTVTLRTRCELIPQLSSTPDSVMSGGEQTQAKIREVLARQPELLLADEPTSNLDTSHIDWLEKQLANWPGALILISHDRAFLDALCTSIWEIRDAQLHIYSGNYSDYTRQRELLDRQHDEAYELYIHEKQQLERAIQLKESKAERATKRPKGHAVESGVTKPYFAKKQKKLQKTAKALETRLEKLETVEKRRELPPIKMNLLHEEMCTGRIIMRINQLSGRAGERMLWHPVSCNVRGGDKLAIIGPNGCGKTTLVKMLLQPDEQHVSISPSVRIGYFSQSIDVLDTEMTILANVRATSAQDESLIRTVLARLHFFRDDVYKPVGVLSGGERVKVALAKLFVSDVNTLILDEPTNFLDIDSIEALETLLRDYEGTVLFISHDRRLIGNLADRILAFEDRHIRLFEGSYAQYMDRLNTTVDERQADVEEQRLLIETRISDVLSRLSIEPSEALEQEFQSLLAARRKLQHS